MHSFGNTPNFGWDYPPGCHSVPGDEPTPPCDICGGDVEEWPGESDGCICPECDICGDYGNPRCYIEHGMRRTEEQRFSLEVHKRLWAYEYWCEIMDYTDHQYDYYDDIQKSNLNTCITDLYEDWKGKIK